MNKSQDFTNTTQNSNINIEILDNQEVDKKKCSNTIKIIIIILIIIFIAAAILPTIIFIKRGDNKKNKT